MKINKAKQKLKSGKPTIGTRLTLGSFHATRVLARMGFDWLTLDVEHAAYDWREIAYLTAVIAEADCVPLVRIPDASPTAVKRALDAGAYGIVVPMIETPEQGRSAIAAAKYPPLGRRRVGGGMHNLNFDCPVEEYYVEGDEQTMVVLQIESPLGVANIEAICRLAGCDAVMIDPTDLRYQCRDADGRFPPNERLEEIILEVMTIGRVNGMPTGIHVSTVEEAVDRIEQGMQLIAVSSDLGMLAERCLQVTSVLGLEGRPDIARY